MYAMVSKHGTFSSAELNREPGGAEVVWLHGDSALCVTLMEARWLSEALAKLITARDQGKVPTPNPEAIGNQVLMTVRGAPSEETERDL